MTAEEHEKILQACRNFHAHFALMREALEELADGSHRAEVALAEVLAAFDPEFLASQVTTDA